MNIRALVLLAALIAPAQLLAAPVTYTFTGLDFSSTIGILTTSESITGSFTLSGPLVDNLFYASTTPTSFTFTDGVETITDSNASSTLFLLSTDASGDLVNWTIELSGSGGQLNMTGPSGSGGQDTAISSGGSGEGIGNTSGGGTFTLSTGDVSATPEPSSLVLLGTGALALAGAARRRLITR